MYLSFDLKSTFDQLSHMSAKNLFLNTQKRAHKDQQIKNNITN